MALSNPLNFQQWIEDNRDKLKPPVGNKMVYPEAEDFIVMVVGGPNVRKDYHYNEGEEFFYMMEGDMTLKVVDDGEFKDIEIKEGEIFLLPPKVLHSPQRPADTVGLVMERMREEGQQDGFIWFCDNCEEKIHEDYTHVSDIEKDLPPIMNGFWDSKENRTCENCGEVLEPAQS
jgi:3-hydroxyanthranilate 3,4-dioxygenase